MYPDGGDRSSIEEFQAGLRDPRAVARIWQKHIDAVNEDEDEDRTEHSIRWKLALGLAKEGVMQKVREGKPAEWPLPPGVYPSMTATDAAVKIRFGGNDIGIDSPWIYLYTIGMGAHGEAGLWISRRTDGNGNLVNVSISLLEAADTTSLIRVLALGGEGCLSWQKL